MKTLPLQIDLPEEEVDAALVNSVVEYIRKRHPKFAVRTKVPLKELFPQPKGPRLQRFWQAQSHADIVIFRNDKLIAILEPGGTHVTDEKQVMRGYNETNALLVERCEV